MIGFGPLLTAYDGHLLVRSSPAGGSRPRHDPEGCRILSRELKELQNRGLIDREQYPVVPPKV